MSAGKETTFISRTASDGKTFRIPVGIITGDRPGPQVTIYGGQHGTEYDGIEAVQRLYRTLQPSELRGKVVFSLATNEASLLNWIQFAPTSPEIVDMMKELAHGSEYLINCHGGEFSEGMCPYVICHLLGDEALDRKAMGMAEAFGFPYISFSKYRGPPPETGVRPAWWLYPAKSMADDLQIPTITPECGQRGSRDESSSMYNGLLNALKYAGVLEGGPESTKKSRTIGDRYWITARQAGLFFPEVDVCQDVVRGQRLGIVRDYFGNVLQEVDSPDDCKVMNLNWGMPVLEGGFLLWLGKIE